MAATQVNIRMDDSLKQAGDEVLERYGFSATQAIRALWEYVAHSGEVPDFMLSAEPDADECARKLALIEGGRGAEGRRFAVRARLALPALCPGSRTRSCWRRPIPNGSDFLPGRLKWPCGLKVFCSILTC